jgi:shikimate kinase
MARNLVLVGFMGSGKSSVGRLVAASQGVDFVDLDQRIEEMTGQSIEAIFEQQGEARFRNFESAALARALAAGGSVVAVGGGAVMDDHNWALIQSGNLVVRLKASDEATLDRLGDGEARPLAGAGKLRDQPELQQKLLTLAAAREGRYAEAQLQVETTGRSIEAVAAEVADLARAAGIGDATGSRSATGDA